MTPEQKDKMAGVKHRDHDVCKVRTGVMRPGKTAKDKSRKK